MKSKIARIIGFFLMLFVLPIVTIALPKADRSYNENRVLQPLPAFSAKSYGDKSFMKDFENFFSDHFAGREQWVSVKTTTELAQGKKELKGVYICDDRLIEKLEDPKKAVYMENINKLNDFEQQSHGKIYFMMVPTAAEIQKNNLPTNAPTYSQSQFIATVNSLLSPKINCLDAQSPLTEAKDEYIFYRTDHHWTSKGAYLTYVSIARSMGLSPFEDDAFKIETSPENFKGTLYSKCLYDGIKDDSVATYTLKSGQSKFDLLDENGKIIQNDSLIFRDNLNIKDKYQIYTGENRGYTKIVKTTNQDSAHPKKLLIFKDSYANTFVPFLANHYDEIVMIDLRYFNKSLSQTVDFAQYDQTLFLYNTDSFAKSKLFNKLAS